MLIKNKKIVVGMDLSTVDNIVSHHLPAWNQNQANQLSKFVRSTIEAVVNLFNSKLKNCLDFPSNIKGAGCDDVMVVSDLASLSFRGNQGFFYDLKFDQENNIDELVVGNLNAPFNGRRFRIKKIREENGEIQCDRAAIVDGKPFHHESPVKCDKANLDTLLLNFNKFMEEAALLGASAPTSFGSSQVMDYAMANQKTSVVSVITGLASMILGWYYHRNSHARLALKAIMVLGEGLAGAALIHGASQGYQAIAPIASQAMSASANNGAIRIDARSTPQTYPTSPSSAGPTPQTSSTSPSSAGPTPQPSSASPSNGGSTPQTSSTSPSSAGPTNSAPTPTPSPPPTKNSHSFAWLGGAAVIGGGLCYAGYKAHQAQAHKTIHSEFTAPFSKQKQLLSEKH